MDGKKSPSPSLSNRHQHFSLAHQAYLLIGKPMLTKISFWSTYKAMIDALGLINDLEDAISYNDVDLPSALYWDEIGGVEIIV